MTVTLHAPGDREELEERVAGEKSARQRDRYRCVLLAMDDLEGDEGEGVASTEAIERLIRAGIKEMNYLNAIMHNKYTRDPDKLRAWKSAAHLERDPVRQKKAAQTPAPAKA